MLIEVCMKELGTRTRHQAVHKQKEIGCLPTSGDPCCTSTTSISQPGTAIRSGRAKGEKQEFEDLARRSLDIFGGRLSRFNRVLSLHRSGST
jgi:hypothetical protein